MGSSRSLFLSPFLEAQCTGSIASVTWSIGDPAIASVTSQVPAYRGSWVTGVAPGSSVVNASIVFADGSAVQAAPREVAVGTLGLPAGTLVAEGVVDLPPSRRYVPFELPRDAGRLDFAVDWGSVLNRVNFELYKGTCSGDTMCAGLEFVALPVVENVKPVRKSIPNAAAGPYTIRIDNTGPGAETVRYEVRSR